MSEVHIFSTHMRLFLSVPKGSTHEAKSAPMDYTQSEGSKKYMKIIINAFYSRSSTHDLSDKCHGEPWVVTKALPSYVPCQCEAERPNVGSKKINLVARRLRADMCPQIVVVLCRKVPKQQGIATPCPRLTLARSRYQRDTFHSITIIRQSRWKYQRSKGFRSNAGAFVSMTFGTHVTQVLESSPRPNCHSLEAYRWKGHYH